jgi:protease-4
MLLPKPVAVLTLEGTIGVGVRPGDWVPVFERLRRRRGTRAVVLEVESRGGSAAASSYLFEAARRLAAEKPVVAFSGGTCASGGYLVACAAREIVVQPGAVVGSIGVISVRPLAEQLLRRLGVAVSVSKSGRLKDMGAFWREPTEEELAKERSLVDEYFELFLEQVRAGRGIEAGRLRELATGEVFSGRQAVELGLADRLGTLQDAVELAARAAGVAARPARFGPRPSLRARLAGRFLGGLAAEACELLLGAAAAEPRYWSPRRSR